MVVVLVVCVCVCVCVCVEGGGGVEGSLAVNSFYFADKDDSNKMFNGEHHVDAAPAQTWQKRAGLRDGSEAKVFL